MTAKKKWDYCLNLLQGPDLMRFSTPYTAASTRILEMLYTSLIILILLDFFTMWLMCTLSPIWAEHHYMCLHKPAVWIWLSCSSMVAH